MGDEKIDTDRIIVLLYLTLLCRSGRIRSDRLRFFSSFRRYTRLTGSPPIFMSSFLPSFP